jgi:hypothetical protein
MRVTQRQVGMYLELRRVWGVERPELSAADVVLPPTNRDPNPRRQLNLHNHL